jgi:hypothetical protein
MEAVPRRGSVFSPVGARAKLQRQRGRPFLMSDRLQCALDAIDAANARDPNKEAGEPAELVYGRRMSEALAAFAPGASEALQIAVRGQHIERWLNPRRDFPDGKAGYIAWRNAAKRRHAERVAGIMAACGYGEAEIARAGALVRKEGLRSDAEAQTLEDIACLVFLRHYALNFAAKHPEEKVLDILVKTQRKMSPRSRSAALDFGLPAPVLALYERAARTLEASPPR